jgi:formate dehydrogenase maturation protein FdhE
MRAAADCPGCGHPDQEVTHIYPNGMTFLHCPMCHLEWVIPVR